jgi:hypothetical protein
MLVMKERILELLNGMNSDSKSASYKCEKELCKILTSVIDKKDKIESYADKYIEDYPDIITEVESLGIYNCLPDIIWCNEEEFKFKTKWLDIDWESYFEELKQDSIKGIQKTIERLEDSTIKYKESLKNISNRNFEDLKF